MKFCTVDLECTQDPTNEKLVLLDQRIVAIGYMVVNTRSPDVVEDFRVLSLQDTIDGVPFTECDLLKIFDRKVREINPNMAVLDYDFVTYSGTRYDMPVLFQRMFSCGFQAEWLLEPKDVRYRYSTQGHFDIAEYVTNYNASTTPSMSALAKSMGLPGKIDMDGSLVQQASSSGQHQKIAEYCAMDVLQESIIRVRLEYMRGLLSAKKYNSIVSSIFRAAIKSPYPKVRGIVEYGEHVLLNEGS